MKTEKSKEATKEKALAALDKFAAIGAGGDTPSPGDEMPPFDASKFQPVPMPGLTGEDLDNIVREGRERGYN